MSLTIQERNHSIKELLNGTSIALKSVIPINFTMDKPALLGKSIQLHFGVLIGFTGDMSGKLILAGEQAVFGKIGESMFGMTVEGEMLTSFSGELGNMVAGSLSTAIVNNGIQTNITSPTIMQGNTTITGYEKAIYMKAVLEIGVIDIYLLLD